MSPAPGHIRPEDLSAYIDGRVGARERQVITAHIATCAECRTELVQLRATVRLLNGLPQVPLPRSFKLAMKHDGRQNPSSPLVRLLPVVRSLSIAAIIVFIVAAGALLLGNASNNDSMPAESSIRSETSAMDGASQGAGESNTSGAQPASGTESPGSGTLIDRGAAASSGSDPLEDLTTLQETPADRATGDAAQAGDIAASPEGGPGRFTSEYGAQMIIGLGILALVLVSLWAVLVRIGRHTGRSAT